MPGNTGIFLIRTKNEEKLIYAAVVAASAGVTFACSTSYSNNAEPAKSEMQHTAMPTVSSYPETKPPRSRTIITVLQ